MRSILLLAAFLLLFHLSSDAQKDFYSERWSGVYRFEVADLPQSALTIVDTIYYKAKKDKNVTETIKALLYQSKFSLTLKENSELIVVEKFKKEIEASDGVMKNVLEAMLAQVYWQYFQSVRWKYYNRTRVAETDNVADFRTWDAATMLREIDLHFRQSLANTTLLRNTRLESFDNILALAENSKLYRPTLYDFVVHYAVDFYGADEHGLQEPSANATFEISNYFSPIDTVTFKNTSAGPGTYQALSLFKDLLAFHKERRDTNAYVNLEIERLNFVAKHSIRDDADDNESLKNALTNLKQSCRNHSVSTLIDLELASLYFSEGSRYSSADTTHRWNKKIALGICDGAIARFPGSYGANRCKVLRQRILATRLAVRAEKFLPADRPSRILVTHTNEPKLYVHLYKVSAEFEKQFLWERNDSVRIAWLAGKAIHTSWQASLPDTHDYQSHSTELVIPALARGHYLVAVSEQSKIAAGAVYAFESVRVSNLAILEIQNSNVKRFRVVDRNNGKPIVGADVHFVNADEGSPTVSIGENLTTDKNGFVELKTPAKTGITIETVVAYNGDTVLGREFYYYKYPDADQEEDDEDVTAKAFVFTDRSIYRPGQSVFFKGILIKIKDERSSIVAGEYVEVSLEDVNGKDVAVQRLKTNAYGSFSGEFKLPETGVTGEYSLNVSEDEESESKFYDDLMDFEYSEFPISVEEYKRPTFEVNIKPLTGTFKLNDTIRVTGNAAAYNNAKIAKAKVAYTVTREVRYPRWWSWRNNSNIYSPAERVAHGEVYTDEKGVFIVPFKAVPDDKVSPDAKPVFSYEISIDVTDINGETRDAESHVSVGYHTMTATIKVPAQVDIQKPATSLSVTTENLNGQFLPANGTVSIYKLQGPARPARQRPWPAPDQPVISKDEFEKLFPNDSYSNDISQPVKWEKGKLAKTLLFDTKRSKEVSFAIDKTWEAGAYIAELKTTDSLGQVVEDKMVFDVVDSKVKGVPDNALLVFKTDKDAYQPGQVAKVTIGSAAPDANITIEIERDNRIVKTITRQLSASTEEISIPVTDAEDGAFSIHCTTVLFNSVIQQHKTISIESEQKKLSIETETFKDKLQPGSKQMWSFTINGTDGQRVEAEVLASMYDASLDQFKSHHWEFDPAEQRNYYSTYRVNSNPGFGFADFPVKNLVYDRLDIPRQNYDEFDWFGFSLTNREYAKRKYLNRLYFDAQSTGKPSKVSMSNNRNGRAGFISGWVISNEGEALPGVNVVVKGTSRGTVTDMDGYYSIEATKDDVLVFSFIGLVSAEAKVGRKNTVDVSMEQDLMQLSEVVVVGYGVQQARKNLAFSVSSVTKGATGSGDVVFEEALEGKVDGLFLRSEPGFGYRVLIRGTASIRDGSSSHGPLYVVDGVPVESSTIDQNNVADIQVLKDAAATAVYGSRGANGVIIITTKSDQQKLDNELAKVNARKNFNETAFFYPHLKTDEEGKIKFSFTTPESLTRWKLQLLAHTKDLVSVTKTLTAVTQKEMMVTPNVPRFLRAGDEVIISAKVANLSGRKLDGKIALQLTDPVNNQAADQLFANVLRNQTFKTGPKGNTQVSWVIKVPQGIDAIQYKIVAKAGSFSDGEQNILPVLQNRMLVTETMPLYVRSNQTKTFNLAKLQNQSSPTLQHHQLTLEITTNPAWYAIQSMPYLMEFPHECAEQLFSRYYANSIAGSIVNSNPKIKEVFNKWAASDKLSSNLEKNQELKSIIIEETPWLRDAESETEQKKRLGLLFDLAAMSAQSDAVLSKLENMQFADGSFPWFAGSRYSDRYITQHVASGFGHMVKLGVSTGAQMKSIMVKAVKYLDSQTTNDFEHMQPRTETYMPNSLEVHYLYMRSFYPEITADANTRAAIEYLQKQTAKKWLEYSLYQKGMIALIQYRSGNKALAYSILSSLRENAIVSDELGMYWEENIGGWYWYQSAIETQALMIEAFAEIGKDNPGLSEQDKQKTVDELQIWLLKNKQTNSWPTTKATTEAVYALLLNGTDWLTLDGSVAITVGKKPVTIDPAEAEAGTGYFKTTWKGEAITPDMATVTISKKDAGISWGGIYWQYFEDLDKITPAETPLKLKKNVYKVVSTDAGEKLYAIQGETLKPGDLVRIRIELTADREMEYLHMKDMRAAGFEPVDVLSGYKWQEGLGYYQSTRDVATNFFFSHISKGVYIFEYDLRVNVKGNFSNGITTIQSMYAPEFSSHSEGIRVTIK